MNDKIKQAYKLGYEYAKMVKSASRSKHKSVLGQYLQKDDINRMLLGTLIGSGSGALIGGQFNRKGGAIGGGLAGAIAANPQLFLALIHNGSRSLYNFASGGSLRG